MRAGAPGADADAEARGREFCHRSVAGTLDIHAMHRASMAPRVAFDAARLRRWQVRLPSEIGPQLPAAPPMLAAHPASDVGCFMPVTTYPRKKHDT